MWGSHLAPGHAAAGPGRAPVRLTGAGVEPAAARPGRGPAAAGPAGVAGVRRSRRAGPDRGDGLGHQRERRGAPLAVQHGADAARAGPGHRAEPAPGAGRRAARTGPAPGRRPGVAAARGRCPGRRPRGPGGAHAGRVRRPPRRGACRSHAAGPLERRTGGDRLHRRVRTHHRRRGPGSAADRGAPGGGGPVDADARHGCRVRDDAGPSRPGCPSSPSRRGCTRWSWASSCAATSPRSSPAGAGSSPPDRSHRSPGLRRARLRRAGARR